MSRWFRAAARSHAPTMVAEEEDRHLQQVEHALLQLLNDDIAQADKILKEQNSSYHHLGRGISSFIASMLGVEKELLKDVSLMCSEKLSFALFSKILECPSALEYSPHSFEVHETGMLTPRSRVKGCRYFTSRRNEDLGRYEESSERTNGIPVSHLPTWN